MWRGTATPDLRNRSLRAAGAVQADLVEAIFVTAARKALAARRCDCAIRFTSCRPGGSMCTVSALTRAAPGITSAKRLRFNEGESS